MLKRQSQTGKLPSARGGDLPKEWNWADGLLLLTVFFWGLNFAVVKFALAEIPPLIFNGLRFAGAAALMVILARATGHRLTFQRRHWPHLVGLAIVGSTAYQLFFILGADNTTVDNTSLILATVPAWVALFGTLTGLEQVTGRGWLGVILSLAGISLIILGSDREVEFRFGGATLYGDVLILLGTLCWAIYTLAIRPMSRYYSAISLTTLPTVLGAILLILMALPSMARFEWRSVSPAAWSALVASGIFAITLAYFFWNYGVSRLGSARTSIYSNLVPLITLVTAWLWLGETLTLFQSGGAALALAGVALARKNTYTVTARPGPAD